MKRMLLTLALCLVALVVLCIWLYQRTIDALQTTVHPAPQTEEAP